MNAQIRSTSTYSTMSAVGRDQPSRDDDPSAQDGLVLGHPDEGGTALSVEWRRRLTKLQFGANVLSHVLALTAICLVSWWIELMGGVSWMSGEAKRTFNYHPLLMVIGFAFMTVASLSFRYPLMRYHSKLSHAISWSVATLCGAVALVAVFKSHNDAQSGFIANLYSLHSWIGILLVAFYLSQWLVGIYAFGFGNPSWKGTAILVHKYVGPILYQGVAVTMLLGIQEKEGFIGCYYEVDEVDSFPIQHFNDIPLSCRVSHSLGLVILTMALSTTFAIHDFGKVLVPDGHVL
jgi:cytochrome b-561